VRPLSVESGASSNHGPGLDGGCRIRRRSGRKADPPPARFFRSHAPHVRRGANPGTHGRDAAKACVPGPGRRGGQEHVVEFGPFPDPRQEGGDQGGVRSAAAAGRDRRELSAHRYVHRRTHSAATSTHGRCKRCVCFAPRRATRRSADTPVAGRGLFCHEHSTFHGTASTVA